MPLYLKKGDINAMHCDAIVIAADTLPSGSAVIEKACNPNAKYIIQISLPEGTEQLASCYKSALTLALEYKCKTVAFPLISAGTADFPENDAMGIAKESIEAFLEEHDMTVYLVAYQNQA